MRSSLLLAAALAATRLTAAPPAPVPTPAQAAAVTDAERIGRDIFDFDQAAWGSTDALLALLSPPSRGAVRGWIVPPKEIWGVDAGKVRLVGNFPKEGSPQ